MKKSSIAIRQLWLVLGVALMVFLDQWTKHIAVDSLKGKEGISFIGDLLVWQYAENKGAAFSMFQGQQWPLTIFSILIALLVLFMFEVSPYEKKFIPLRIAYIGVIAGAIGNMIDRISLNYVIDFIYVKIINFPIFNVADICVTCSCILLFVLFLFVYKENDKLTILKSKKDKEPEKRDE